MLQTAIQISISLIPIIVRIVFVSIRPAVCQIHFPLFRTNVGKSVQHVGKLVDRNILGLMVASINRPILRRR